jgi:hypothetical protein
MDAKELDAFWRTLDTHVDVVHTNSTQTMPCDMTCESLLMLAKDKAVLDQDFELAAKIRDAVSFMGKNDLPAVRF